MIFFLFSETSAFSIIAEKEKRQLLRKFCIIAIWMGIIYVTAKYPVLVWRFYQNGKSSGTNLLLSVGNEQKNAFHKSIVYFREANDLIAIP